VADARVRRGALRKKSDVRILRAAKNTRGRAMIAAIYVRESADQPIADQEIP